MKTTKFLLWVVFLGMTAGAFASPQSNKQGTLSTLQTAKAQYPALASKLQQAIDKVQDSLLDDTTRWDCDPSDGDDPEDGRSLFVAPDILDPARGARTFEKEEGAVDVLTDLLSKNTTPAAARSVLIGVVNTLVEVDRAVTRKAIDDGRAFLGARAASNSSVREAEARYHRASLGRGTDGSSHPQRYHGRS